MSQLKNKNKIKRLVKNNCACFLGDKQGISNYCCFQDGSCVFFNQDDSIPSCSYFENGILPIDEQLEYDYKLERNMEVENRTIKPKVKCKSCGDTFAANSNRQMYCEKCKQYNEKQKVKLRMRKMRKKEVDVTV